MRTGVECRLELHWCSAFSGVRPTERRRACPAAYVPLNGAPTRRCWGHAAESAVLSDSVGADSESAVLVDSVGADSR